MPNLHDLKTRLHARVLDLQTESRTLSVEIAWATEEVSHWQAGIGDITEEDGETTTGREADKAAAEAQIAVTNAEISTLTARKNTVDSDLAKLRAAVKAFPAPEPSPEEID